MNTAIVAKLSLAAAATTLTCACNKPSSQSSAPPFDWTNIIHNASAFKNSPSTGTLVHFANGGWFGHYEDRLTLGLGTADYEATVFYNASNRAVTKIIQQTTIGTNHYWLIDRNGDGLPDERRSFGDKTRDLLIRGEWSPSRGPASEPEVFDDGNWSSAHFTNAAWRIKTTPKLEN